MVYTRATILCTVYILFLLLTMCSHSNGAALTYSLSFEDPMSWSDDVTPWGDSAVQEWEIADGGKQGKCLRITGTTYKRTVSYEIRTLQFNHKPDTPATVSFDFKDVCVPPGSFLMLRYFDGYCGGQAFHWVADDKFKPFPAPLFDSRTSKLTRNWQRVSCSTPPLKNTVLPLAFIVQQPRQDRPVDSAAADAQFVEFLLDNLSVRVTALDKLMDPDFDWHGNYGGSTVEFRQNTLGANADWCDFADQEVADFPIGGKVRYTLFQFSDATTQKNPGTRHNLIHEEHATGAGGVSAVHLNRWCVAGNLSAVSWGVRQTVAYESLGLKPDESAKIRVTMRMTQLDHDNNRASRIQLGVDPEGGIVTQKALWTPEERVCIRHDNRWSTPSIEFVRPKGSTAFTIYFRQRDGIPKDARDKSYPPDPKEPQSQGTESTIEAYADWVLVELVR